MAAEHVQPLQFVNLTNIELYRQKNRAKTKASFSCKGQHGTGFFRSFFIYPCNQEFPLPFCCNQIRIGKLF